MSIAYFPTPYEDELVYSVIARYYAHSGYLYYKNAEKDLFLTKMGRVDKEFVKQLRPEVVKLLSKNKGVEELIEKHTMYPCYGRFLDKDRRKIAYEALKSMDGDFSKLFGIPKLKKGEERFFRHCPLCIQEDREKYGETYYHRIHQIRGISVCAKHGCYLLNSRVKLSSIESISLTTAEQSISEEGGMDTILFCKNSLELELTRYMTNIFQKPINRKNPTLISDYLHHKIVGTPYLSSRGEHKYFHRLWEDMKKYYHGVLEVNDFLDVYVERLLNGKRFIYHEICMVAMFLNIREEELTEMQVPFQTPEQQFDEKVKRLLDSGIGVNETARKLGVSSSMVQMVIKLSKESKKKQYVERCTGKQLDWVALDEENLVVVKQAIMELHGTGVERPCKVSFYAVGKKSNIAVHRLRRMELCKKEIESHFESKEQYFARKVIWGVHMLERDNKPIQCWRITAITKLEREDIIICLSELEKLDKNIYNEIRSII